MIILCCRIGIGHCRMLSSIPAFTHSMLVVAFQFGFVIIDNVNCLKTLLNVPRGGRRQSHPPLGEPGLSVIQVRASSEDVIGRDISQRQWAAFATG